MPFDFVFHHLTNDVLLLETLDALLDCLVPRNNLSSIVAIMRAKEDSGLETTLERRSVRKGPLIQRFVRSVRESFTPLRSGGGSTSILRNNENQGVELYSDSPHQSDIDLLDSNEIKELRNDDQ
ncbi:hypothetical protein OUZ56_012122 [Daphnia magna]|uniref:Uncharacterized protein n=1 Tax=Daphnia magna TaxID=35525 RepID=A0ABQ9Z265_9CRUS|nr:hypothetical protein OUZ56_012122 [Daphnia magna]